MEIITYKSVKNFLFEIHMEYRKPIIIYESIKDFILRTIFGPIKKLPYEIKQLIMKYKKIKYKITLQIYCNPMYYYHGLGNLCYAI